MRLTPLPYSIVSYLLGVTKVSIKDFLIGTSIESVHIALWLYIGKSLERFSDINSKLKSPNSADSSSNSSMLEFVMIGLEILMVFIVGFLVSYKAKVELDR